MREGNLKIIWPLKVLRFMVGTIVTTVFSTALEWLIYPVDCEADLHTLTKLLHGEHTHILVARWHLPLFTSHSRSPDCADDPDAGCSPWGVPEVLITVPSLLLAVLYIVASLGTTWL
eukprot:271959-Rhodomonas_salina.2